MQAPLQMEMDVKNVPSEFRYDPKSVKYAQARAYADSFGPGQVRASNAQGCKRCHGCFGACVVCPTWVYLWPFSENCICGWWAFCGIPIPLYSCITMCFCERDGNAWVIRDKHGIKQGEFIIVDMDTGASACYSVKCCTNKILDEAEPSCWFT